MNIMYIIKYLSADVAWLQKFWKFVKEYRVTYIQKQWSTIFSFTDIQRMQCPLSKISWLDELKKKKKKWKGWKKQEKSGWICPFLPSFVDL